METIPRPYAHESNPKPWVLKDVNSIDVTLSFDDVEHLTQALKYYRRKDGTTVGEYAHSEKLADQLNQAVETQKEKRRKQQEHIEREKLISEARRRLEADYRAPVIGGFVVGVSVTVLLSIIGALIYAQL